MAAAYLRKMLDDLQVPNVEVRSAGVMTVTGLRASQEAIQIMAANQVDLTRHRSSQLTTEMIRKSDLILGMSPLHVQTAVRMCEEARGKAFLFKEFTQSDLKNVQITDPMGCTLEVFKRCFKEIREACARLLKSEFLVETPKPKSKSTESKPAEHKTASTKRKSDAGRKPAKMSKRGSSASKSGSRRISRSSSHARARSISRKSGRSEGLSAKAK